MEQATEWQIPIFVMHCDVLAAFDHVSHHGIIEALEDMKSSARVDCSVDQGIQRL